MEPVYSFAIKIKLLNLQKLLKTLIILSNQSCALNTFSILFHDSFGRINSRIALKPRPPSH